MKKKIKIYYNTFMLSRLEKMQTKIYRFVALRMTIDII